MIELLSHLFFDPKQSFAPSLFLFIFFFLGQLIKKFMSCSLLCSKFPSRLNTGSNTFFIAYTDILLGDSVFVLPFQPSIALKQSISKRKKDEFNGCLKSCTKKIQTSRRLFLKRSTKNCSSTLFKLPWIQLRRVKVFCSNICGLKWEAFVFSIEVHRMLRVATERKSLKRIYKKYYSVDASLANTWKRFQK